MNITAMKQALEALDKIYDGCGFVIEDKLHKDAIELAKLVRKDCFEPITAMRQAIEQAELVQRAEEAFDRSEQYVMENAQGNLERIFLEQTGVGIGTQVQRQPLDDLTILDLADKHLHDQETYQALAFARAIEREIKENK